MSVSVGYSCASRDTSTTRPPTGTSNGYGTRSVNVVIRPPCGITTKNESALTSPDSTTSFPTSLSQRPQFGLLAVWQRIAVDVQHHRHEAVVAHHAGQVDDAALAELVDCCLEDPVADLPGSKELVPEVVDGLFVRLHRAGPLACRDRFDDGRIQSCRQCVLLVGRPFVLRVPEAGRHQDRHLVQPIRQRRMKAQLRAKRLCEVAHLGAAPRDVERSVHPAAFSRDNVFYHGFLLGLQLVVGERLKSIAAQVEIASGWRLRQRKTRQDGDAEIENVDTHRMLSFRITSSSTHATAVHVPSMASPLRARRRAAG